MPLWYVPRDGEIWIWTYAKSQKVKNLERDPRATLLIETGVEYGELRGVQIEAEAELIRDVDRVVDFAKDLTVRYSEGIESVEGDAAAALRGAGAEARRDPLPPETSRHLGPPQARGHVLGLGGRSFAISPQFRGGIAWKLAESPPGHNGRQPLGESHMRRIAIALTALGALFLGASSAQAAVLTSSGSVIYYTAGQGERNDVVIGTDRLLGGTVPVYTFKDADANPIQIGGGPCELINGVGDCRQTGITSFFVDFRDRQ